MSLLTKALALNGPMLSALTVAKGTKVSAERDLKSVDDLAALLTSPLSKRYFTEDEIRERAREEMRRTGKSAGELLSEKASGPFAIGTDTDLAAHSAATSPTNGRAATDGQIEAGNYKKGHIIISGLDLSIENPEGSTRSSKPGVEPAWEREIKDAHYGYLKGTIGQDKDHLDIFLKPSTPIDWSGSVYVIHQTDQDSGEFDEHKVMLGYDSEEAAKSAYKANYPDGWTVGNVESMTLSEFKDWTASGSVVQRLFGSARKVAFAQPAPFLSKVDQEYLADVQLVKDITTGTGLSTPMAGLTHYDRKRTAKQAFDDTVAAVDAARRKQITDLGGKEKS